MNLARIPLVRVRRSREPSRLSADLLPGASLCTYLCIHNNGGLPAEIHVLLLGLPPYLFRLFGLISYEPWISATCRTS